MALQGTLDTFSVPDVLRLLAATRKQGRLLLHGTRGEGSVWLDDGRVVDVTVPAAPEGGMADALFEILRAAHGAFAFEAGLAAPDGADEGQDVEALLCEVEERVAEWQQIEGVVPSLRAFVALNPELPDGSVTLDADTWRVVVAIAGGATVAELAGDLGVTEVPARRAVREAVELGIAICAPKPPDGWDELASASEVPADPTPDGGHELGATNVSEVVTAAGVAVEKPVPGWDLAPADVPVPAWDDAPAALAWADDPAPAPWASGSVAVLPPAPWHGDLLPDTESVGATSAPFPAYADAGPRDGWSNPDAWARPDPELAPLSESPSIADLAPLSGSPSAPDNGLSPQAAHALATVIGDTSGDAAAEDNRADDPGQRGLLVKFLSSVRP